MLTNVILCYWFHCELYKNSGVPGVGGRGGGSAVEGVRYAEAFTHSTPDILNCFQRWYITVMC